MVYRRKFRSQTSDNMDRWKRDEKRRREKLREEKKKERVRRKKMQVREKVGKSRNTVFFSSDLSLRGVENSRLAKAAGAESFGEVRDEQLHVVVVHFEVKMYKASHVRNTFGSWYVEKVHAVVVRSTFPSQNVKSTTCSDCSDPLLKVQMWFCVAGAGASAPCRKWSKLEDFVAFPKRMAGVWHLKRILKDAVRVAGAIQKTCSSEMLGGQGRALISWEVLHFGASDLQVC